MAINKARAIEYHGIAAKALRLAAEKHEAAAALLNDGNIDAARELAREAHQLGLEAALKSDSAAAASAGAPVPKEWVNPPLPQREPDPPLPKQLPVEGPDNPRA
jgi:hypothetical protein